MDKVVELVSRGSVINGAYCLVSPEADLNKRIPRTDSIFK